VAGMAAESIVHAYKLNAPEEMLTLFMLDDQVYEVLKDGFQVRLSTPEPGSIGTVHTALYTMGPLF
jgi:hypothetical protein